MHLNYCKNSIPFRHSVGDGTAVQKFVRGKIKKGIRKIFDENKKVLGEEPFEIPYVEEIPLSEQLHPVEETADIYSLENLASAGIKVNPVPSNLHPLSLEKLSQFRDDVDNLNVDSLATPQGIASIENPNVEPINFNNNEN